MSQNSEAVFGCVVSTPGHVLLRIITWYNRRWEPSRGILALYLQSKSEQATHAALEDIRRKTDTDLWVIEVRDKIKGYSVVATPFYVPATGAALHTLYSFIVTENGINRDALKEQYRSCLEIAKFASPMCSGCRFGVSECLSQYHIGEKLPHSVSAPIELTKNTGGGSSTYPRPYEAAVGAESFPGKLQHMHVLVDYDEQLAAINKLLQVSALVVPVESRHAYITSSGMFNPGIRSPVETDTSQENIVLNKQGLRDRSLASAKSRKVLREECPKCLIRTKCDQLTPRTCTGAITNLDSIRTTLRTRVVEYFGVLPKITDQWVQATLKMSGECIGLRIPPRRNGRPANVAVAMVLPAGCRYSRSLYGRQVGSLSTASVVLVHRGLHIVLPLNDGYFTNYKVEQVLAILARPDIVLDDDTLLRAMFLLTTTTLRGSYGSYKVLSCLSIKGEDVEVCYQGSSRYSWRLYKTKSLSDTHLPELWHNLRTSVVR